MKKRLLLFTGFILFALLCMIDAHAQKKIYGTIRDGDTGETLPAANIVEVGTYNGTVSNADGFYTLTLKNIPAEVMIRFLGYETTVLKIDADSPDSINVEMKPSLLQLQEIVVTDENPALSIMERVIARKQLWRQDLNTYKAEAYTRQRLESDTSIVSITESLSALYWDKEKGVREVILSQRQTANIDVSDNFSTASDVPNFYNDNLSIAGFDIVGPTHPDALKFYNFEVVGFSSLDDKLVYEIKMTTKKKLQPTFEGTIYVLDEEFAMIAVDLVPNKVVNFPPPVQDFEFTYKQQFNNFGTTAWLPVDVEISGFVKIGIIGLKFPPIGFYSTSRIYDYEINVEHPDSLFKPNRRRIIEKASTQVSNSDSLFTSNEEIIPLSLREKEAYATIDSTATLEKAFRPKGFLARFIDLDDEDENNQQKAGEEQRKNNTVSTADSTQTQQTTRRVERGIRKWTRSTVLDAPRFNRVDLLYFGLKTSLNSRRINISGFGGYSTGYEEASYGGSLRYWLKEGKTYWLRLSGYAQTATRYQSQLWNMTTNSFPTLLGGKDFFDYYRQEGFSLEFGGRVSRRDLDYNIKLVNEEHNSISFFSNYDLLGNSRIHRANPLIDEGYLRSLSFSTKIGDAGTDSYGVVGGRSIRLSAEFSGDYLDSDFNFTKYEIDISYSVQTFLKRRLFPNTLDMRILAGTSTGTLPFQKYGILDSGVQIFTPFGAFKTRRDIPFEGEHYVGAFVEHNFRTVPFELLGFDYLVDKNIGIIAFASAGATWIESSRVNEFIVNNGFAPAERSRQFEVGLSVNSIFSIMRVDFAQRLNDPAFYVGISVARWF